jgi:cytochrome b subunit of formate dehydrogenase
MDLLFKLNTNAVDLLLDEGNCPVARMRLFSEGIHLNNRFFRPDVVIGDRGCIACGNCVDACPVVREKHAFVFQQSQRTSMALENLVGEECRRCYKCIVGCPQVSKFIKEYSLCFRRGEKIVHLMTAAIIFTLAVSGIILFHYSDDFPIQLVNLLRYSHITLGFFLILMPVLYLILDRKHMFRFLRKVFVWERKDWDWLKALVRHLRSNKRYPMPHKSEFNPGQKAWYLFIVFALPVLGVTGIIQWLGLSYGLINVSFLANVMLFHMVFALAMDLLLFIHVYLKYLRNWIILSIDLIKVFIRKRHLLYPYLYESKPTQIIPQSES